MTSTRAAWPMGVNYSDLVLQRAEWLYAALDNEGWAEHRDCGDPSDGMCGKEWAERTSVLDIAFRLLFLEQTTPRAAA